MVGRSTFEGTSPLSNHTLNCDGIVTGWGAYSCISVHLFVDRPTQVTSDPTKPNVNIVSVYNELVHIDA